jgi:hypothetical protein
MNPCQQNRRWLIALTAVVILDTLAIFHLCETIHFLNRYIQPMHSGAAK